MARGSVFKRNGGWAFRLDERLLRQGVGRAARVAALHHLIEHVPAPVLADLIGYNPNFIADRAASLATNWASYPTLRARTSTSAKDSPP